MQQLSHSIRKVWLLAIPCLLFLTACQHYDLRSCLAVAQSPQPNLNLSQFQVVIDRKSIAGIKNLSGLTWNNDSQTLFAVTNKLGQILELSPQGDLLRIIETKGIRDAEAIEYLGNNEFIIADERFQKLLKVTVDKDTSFINAHLAPQLIISKPLVFNRGLEGLAFDNKQHIIYSANESDPIAIYKISYFFDKTQQPHIEHSLNNDNKLFIKDISGLHLYQPLQHLLVLSDESKVLIEFNTDRQIISCLPLTAGKQGLYRSVRQPEGVAMDNNDNLYIVSEPNLFYKFKKNH